MLYIRDDNWIKDVHTAAGAVIIPVAARYPYFADRNFDALSKINKLPPSLRWFLKNYSKREDPNTQVDIAPYMHLLTAGTSFSKNASEAIVSHYASPSIKPANYKAGDFDSLPTVIGLSTITSPFCFDIPKNKPDERKDNFLINKPDISINGAITRAVNDALININDKPGANMANLKARNTIYIAPLFRELTYMPDDLTNANSNWMGLNYINSIMMSLAPFKLDHMNIHIFHTHPVYTS